MLIYTTLNLLFFGYRSYQTGFFELSGTFTASYRPIYIGTSLCPALLRGIPTFTRGILFLLRTQVLELPSFWISALHYKVSENEIILEALFDCRHGISCPLPSLFGYRVQPVAK